MPGIWLDGALEWCPELYVVKESGVDGLLAASWLLGVTLTAGGAMSGVVEPEKGGVVMTLPLLCGPFWLEVKEVVSHEGGRTTLGGVAEGGTGVASDGLLISELGGKGAESV